MRVTELRIRDLVAAHCPDELDLPYALYALWTRRALQALVLREAGLEMPIRMVGEYLRRWGYTSTANYQSSHDCPEQQSRLVEGFSKCQFFLISHWRRRRGSTDNYM